MSINVLERMESIMNQSMSERVNNYLEWLGNASEDEANFMREFAKKHDEDINANSKEDWIKFLDIVDSMWDRDR